MWRRRGLKHGSLAGGGYVPGFQRLPFFCDRIDDAYLFFEYERLRIGSRSHEELIDCPDH